MENLKRTTKNKQVTESHASSNNASSYLDEIEASLNNINHDFFQKETDDYSFVNNPIQTVSSPNSNDTAGISLKDILESKYAERMPKNSRQIKRNVSNNSVLNESALVETNLKSMPNKTEEQIEPVVKQEEFNEVLIENEPKLSRSNPKSEVVAGSTIAKIENEMQLSRAKRENRKEFLNPYVEEEDEEDELPSFLFHKQDKQASDEELSNIGSHLVDDKASFDHTIKAIEQDDIDDILNKIREQEVKEGVRTDVDTRMDILRKMATNTDGDGSDFEVRGGKRHNKALEELVASIEKDQDVVQDDLRSLEQQQAKTMFGDTLRPSELLNQDIMNHNHTIQSSNQTAQHKTAHTSVTPNPHTEELEVLQVGLKNKEAKELVDTLNLSNLALVEKTQEFALQLHEYEEDLEYIEGNLQKTNRLIVFLLVCFVLLIIILGVYVFTNLSKTL